jgi:hypothetical protein
MESTGVEVPIIAADGKLTHGPKGKVLNQKVRMDDATFSDDMAQ